MQRSVLGLILILAFLCEGFTAEKEVSEDVTEKNVLNEESDSEQEMPAKDPFCGFPDINNVGGKIEEQINEYLKSRTYKDENGNEHSYRIGENGTDGRNFYIAKGVSTINRNINEIDFAQARILAYERAIIEAKSEFVRARNRINEVKTYSHYFKNDPNYQEADAKGRIEILKDKVLLCAEGEIDKKLEMMGFDTEEFDNKTLIQKRDLFRDSFNMESITRTGLEAMSGTKVLATFDGEQKEVGVLLLCSDKLRGIAADIMRETSVPVSNGAKRQASIAEQIDDEYKENLKEFISAYGVRVMEDENGEHAVVSFGQWSPRVTKQTPKLELDFEVKGAKIQARSIAEANLTRFVNSTVLLTEKTMIKSEKAIREEMYASGFPKKPEENQIADAVDRVVKESGRTHLEGVVTVKEWGCNDPTTGHLLFGCVLMWSPSTKAMMADFSEPPRTQRTSQENAKSAGRSKGEKRQSSSFKNEVDW